MTSAYSRRGILGGMGAAAVLSATGGAGLAQGLQRVIYAETEGFHWIVPYVASAKGTWVPAGVDLQTVVFPVGRLGMEACLSGKADFAICTDTPYVFAAMRGLKPQVVAPFSRNATGSKITVRNDRIRAPQDIKGKTVATVIGGGGHYFLTRFLKHYGMTVADVKLINLSPPEFVTAIARGDVDAFSWDLQAAVAGVERGQGKVSILDTSDSAKYFTALCLMMANEKVVKERPEACKAVVRALWSALAFAKANPEETVDIVSARTKTTKDASRTAIADFELDIRFDGDVVEALVEQSEWAIENRQAQRPAADLKAFYRDLMYVDGVRALSAGAVSI